MTRDLAAGLAFAALSLSVACTPPGVRGPAVSRVLETRGEGDGLAYTEHRVSYTSPGIVGRIETLWQGSLLRDTGVVYEGDRVVGMNHQLGDSASAWALMYDGDRLIEQDFGSGARQTYRYDVTGKVTGAQLAVNTGEVSEEWEFAYDTAGKLIRIGGKASQSAIHLVRDSSGAIREVFEDFRGDHRDRRWSVEYGADGRLSRVTGGESELSFEYSPEGFISEIEEQEARALTRKTIELSGDEVVGAAFSPPFALGAFFDLEGRCLETVELPALSFHER